MTISNYRNLQKAVNNAKAFEIMYSKAATGTESIFTPDFYWRMAGFPLAGAVPATGAGTIPTRTTTGAIPMPDLGGSDKRFLTSFGVCSPTLNPAVGYWLVDVLWMNSGLSGTVATPQSFTSSALTRYTDGIGNWVGLVCWTATGSTTANVTMSYTNQAGTAGQTTPSVVFWSGGFSGTATLPPTADQMQFLPLQAGDYGIRAIASVTLSASTLTAGDFGAIIFHPLAFIAPGGSNVDLLFYQERDFVLQNSYLPEIVDEACLAIIGVPNSTGGDAISGRILMIDG